MENETIIVRVYNSKILKTLVGQTEFSASSIYYEKEHTFRHRWFFLSNVNKDYQKIMGYIKISANFTRSDQKKALLSPESPEETMMGQNIHQLSIPPQFKLERKQIQVNIYEADRLFLMDDHWTQGKGSDPYVKLYLGGSEIKTQHLSIKGVKTPLYWKLYVTLIYPTFIDNLSLSLKDYETGLKTNEVFGSKRFSVEDIKNGKFTNPFWCYIYGGPEYYEHEEIKKKMDQFPEIASTFKGSIYMSMKMIDAISNSNFREKMTELDVLKPPRPIFFKAKFEFYSVQNFYYEDNDDDDEHFMEINWGGKIVGSKKFKIKNNLLEFYDFVEIEEGFSCNGIEELPDIIVALTKYKSSRKKIRRVCFVRLRPEDYVARDNINDKYIFLNIDKSVSDVADDGSGILHFKMGVNRTDLWTQNQMNNFNINLKKPEAIPIMVAVNVFQAKGLPAGDDDGSGDPVVQVYHYGTRQRSSIFLKTLNPVWNERVILATYAIGSFIPPVIINVHDYDPKSDSKDPKDMKEGTYEFLGNTCIFIGRKNRVNSLSQIPEPEWYDLKYSKDSIMGRISLSVTISLPEGQYFRSHVSKMKEDLEKHLVKIRILGLRNLQSSGLIPITKPYIKINTTSLILRAGSNETVPYSVLETIPKQGGSDPNIGEIMNMDVDLPVEDSLKPSISCEVLDQALFGTNEKSLGNFEIDIGYYSLLSKVSLNQRLKLLKVTLQEQNRRPDAIPILDRIIQELNKSIKDQGSRLIQAGTMKLNEISPLNEKHSVATQIASYLIDNPKAGSKNHSEQQFAPKKVVQPSKTQLNNLIELSDAKTDKIVEFSNSKHNNNTQEDIEMPKVRNEDESIAPQQADFDQYRDNIFVIKPKYERVVNNDKEKENNNEEVEDEELAKLKSSSGGKFTLKEVDVPDLTKYRAVGFDSAQKKAKHYRMVLGTCLEESSFIGKSEFDSIDIVRGKRIKSDTSFIEKFFKSKDQFRKVGIFKGGVSCISIKMLNALSKLNLDEELDNFNIPYSKESWENRQIDKDMLQKVVVQTRVYILEAQLYKSEDKYSKNDPYIKVFLGKDEFNGRDEAFEDRDFAIFNKRIV